jgi:hypothetical protein
VRPALLVLPVAVLSMACAAATQVIFPPTPTVTAWPTSTLTPSSTPTITPRPSATATSTPDYSPTPFTPLPPTPTYIPPSLTPTPTEIPALGCKLNWQSPGNGITFKPLTVFTVGWNVTNTGFETWEAGSVELTYVSGSPLAYRETSAPLIDSVAPGESTTLTADMRSPVNSTRYTTYWSLRLGDVFFCPLRVTIYVE